MLTSVGVYMLLKLRFFFILHPIKTVKKIKSTVKDRGSVTSLALALAGTLGIGNIFGVSLGIIIGGPGSVFWMLVSTVFASVIKYSEIVISTDGVASEGHEGSVFRSLPSNLGRVGVLLSITYALACLFLSFSMGVGLQVGAVSEAICTLFNTPPIVIGLLALLIILFSVKEGVGKIEKITALAIPLTTSLYIFIASCSIAVSSDRIGYAIGLIMKDAIRPRSAVGGIFGFVFSRAVLEGYTRGILSNEAGTGTSSMAHSRSRVKDPSSLGLMGIVEVFFDTVLLCMLTALTILTSPTDYSSYTSGMTLVLDAVSMTLGRWAGVGVVFSSIIFAYATVVCWYYYGSQCATFLFGKLGRLVFLPLYLFAIVITPFIDNRMIVAATDIFILIMTSITLLLIIKKSDRILLLSERGGVVPRSLIKGILSRRGEKDR